MKRPRRPLVLVQVQLQALTTQKKHKSQIEQNRDEMLKLKDEVSRLRSERASSQQSAHVQQHREETRKLHDEISRLQGELSAAKQPSAHTSTDVTATSSFIDASEDVDSRDDHLLRL